jgi:hypothetical protein
MDLNVKRPNTVKQVTNLYKHRFIICTALLWKTSAVNMRFVTLEMSVTKVKKVKLSLWFLLTEHHATKAYWGSGGIAPCILDLGTRWRWVASFTPRPLYPQEKSRWYPSDRRLGGLQSWSGRGGGEKNSQPLPGTEPSIIQPVDQRYTTRLPRLLRLLQRLTKVTCFMCFYQLRNLTMEQKTQQNKVQTEPISDFTFIFILTGFAMHVSASW